MTNEIRLVILVIGLIFIALIIWDGLRRQRQTHRQQAFDDTDSESSDDVTHQPSEQDASESTEIQEKVDLPDFEVKADSQSLEQVIDSSDGHDKQAQSANHYPPLVICHLIAHSKQYFGGFSLLHVLLEHGFQYGDMGIFHYYAPHRQDSKKLFSLAAATSTGDFPISDMASFHCSGLIIFMYPSQHQHPSQVFDDMVRVTEQLAQALNADLKIGRDQQEWTEDNLAYWYQQLLS